MNKYGENIYFVVDCIEVPKEKYVLKLSKSCEALILERNGKVVQDFPMEACYELGEFETVLEDCRKIIGNEELFVELPYVLAEDKRILDDMI